MRKYIISAAMAVAALAAFPASAAGDAKATVYTPEQGDIAFGVDVVPLLRTIADAFDNHKYESTIGGVPFKAPEGWEKPNIAVSAKYMLTDRLAVSALLGVTVKSETDREYVTDDLAAALDPLSDAKVIDQRRSDTAGGSLMAGVEYRLGKRRVQGIFGGGLLFGFSTNSVSYSYGNKMTSLNQRPTSAFGSDGSRYTSCRPDGPAFALGAYGKMGVECFVAPKVAVGATVDLYLYGTFGPNGYVKEERFNASYNKVEETTRLVIPGNRGFYFGTDNIGGSLYLAFYF